MSGAASAHLGLVHVEHAGVVRLALVGVEVDDLGVDLIAVLGSGLAGDADTAVDVQSALERLVGLETNNGLTLGMLGVDVAGRMRQDTGHDLGVHVENTALLTLLEHEGHDVIPQLGGALGGAHQERFIALVGGVVLLDEVADIDLFGPITVLEAFPCLLHYLTTLLVVLSGRLSPRYPASPNSGKSSPCTTRRENACV